MSTISEDAKKYKIVWDGANKVMTIKFIGDFNDIEARAYAEEVVKKVEELRNKGEKVDKGMIDLSEAGNPNLKARVILSKTSKKIVNGVDNAKLAYLKANAFDRFVVSFIHTAVQQDVRIKFVETKDEALKWLKS